MRLSLTVLSVLTLLLFIISVPPGQAQVAPSLSGTVARFLVNPHGDIDRLILSGGEEITFKPHQAALLVLMLARINGPISIAGFGTTTEIGTVVNGETIASEGHTIWTRE